MLEKRKIRIILFLSLLFTISISVIDGAWFNFKVELKSENFNDNKIKLKKAGFWDLTGTRIFIDDSDPNYYWSKTAADNDWCSGEGTLDEPYVIENITIDGEDIDSCISIFNSDVQYLLYILGNNPFPFSLINLSNVMPVTQSIERPRYCSRSKIV